MEQVKSEISVDVLINLLDKMPDGVLLSKGGQEILWCNTAMTQILDLDKTAVLDKTFEQLSRHLLRPISSSSETILIPGKDKSEDRFYRHHTLDVEQGLVANIYTDVTEIAHLLNQQDALTEQLHQLSTSDPTSGLLNHRAMLQHLEPLVSRSRRYGNHLSVIAMEVINADHIRDTHGEPAFNEAIVAIGQLLKDQMRWADIVSRSEEKRFVFVLPETEKDSAVHLANKIAAQLADMLVHHDGNQFIVETGFGVTGWEKGNDSVLLLRRASQALDAARQKGQGSVESA